MDLRSTSTTGGVRQRRGLHGFPTFLLLLIGLAMLSSVAGLNCHTCSGDEECNTGPKKKEVCDEKSNTCSLHFRKTDMKQVVSAGCMKNEDPTTRCEDYGADGVGCFCAMDLCNSETNKNLSLKEKTDKGDGTVVKIEVDDKKTGGNEPTTKGAGGLTRSGLRPILVGTSILFFLRYTSFLS